MIRILGLILMGLALLSGGFAQEAESKPKPAKNDAARLIRLARTGKSVVRPQAARRLQSIGPPGGVALLEAAGETNAEFAALGKDLVEVAGSFPFSPALRVKLWAAIADADFPWRPSAAIGLASLPKDLEVDRFGELLQDPLAAVRNAAVTALGELEAKQYREDLTEQLCREEDDRVRRNIAAQLDGWGERWALWYLLEDLHRTDAFFGQPTGSMARLYSTPLLIEQLDQGDFGFQPALDPTTESNAKALDQLKAAVEKAAGPKPTLPAVTRSFGPPEGERLGLELRSCRRGEFFLRWTTGDELLVGRGTPARVTLPPGTVAALAALLEAQAKTLDGKLFWGEPGCDQETFHFGPSRKENRVILLSKGPEPVPGLRPPGLNAAAEALVASLPEGASEDPRLDRLRERVLECLVAIGGPIATDER